MLSFRKRFTHFVERNRLFSRKDMVLLAVSAGVDSVVMAHLFAEAGLNFGIVHANFGLRGRDSDADEQLVKDLALRLNAPFYTRKFETRAYAAEKGISIQMAARELRYAWFEEVRSSKGYSFIATAHHKNDSVETILLNLVKGSIIHGLHGILPINDLLVRPMLWAGKDEISEFAIAREMVWREDMSNLESKYQRNFIRNEIMVELQKINPSLVTNMDEASRIRYQVEQWFSKHCSALWEKLAHKDADRYLLMLNDILIHQIDEAILLEFFQPFGFNLSQIQNLFLSMQETESKAFFSPTHRLLKEREGLVLLPIGIREDITYEIQQDTTSLDLPDMNISIMRTSGSNISGLTSRQDAFLDAGRLQFPLRIRRWQQGDSFLPYGMKQRKKLSDFLTDQKLSRLEKESQLVLLSGNDIVWVIGRRIDDRYKVDRNTNDIIHIHKDAKPN